MTDTPSESELSPSGLYLKYRDELTKVLLSASESFDRSILSLSSGLLAASLVFIRPTSGTPPNGHVAILAWSWVFLTAAILVTMASFLTTQLAVMRQLQIAESHILKGLPDSPNHLGRFSDRLTWASGALFGIGVILTVWFSILSIPSR